MEDQLTKNRCRQFLYAEEDIEEKIEAPVGVFEVRGCVDDDPF